MFSERTRAEAVSAHRPNLSARTSFDGVRGSAAVVWLAFIVFPVLDAIAGGGSVVTQVLAVGESTLAGEAVGAAVGFGASTLGVGLLMVLMRDLRTRNDELNEARAELARLAVAQERQRFARDLHDLFGHTLSVITLKAELAGRLLPDSPHAAGREVAEVEQVARKALVEVRQAVSGYRQPTLEGELEGAQMALSAAGIEADMQRSQVAFDPEVEAVRAWTVREGATNVIRHSRASWCTLKITGSLGDAAAEVLDNGGGIAVEAPADVTAGHNGNGGHGLEGLTERAHGLRGKIEAGSRPEGGFRLAVTVPLARPVAEPVPGSVSESVVSSAPEPVPGPVAQPQPGPVAEP